MKTDVSQTSLEAYEHLAVRGQLGAQQALIIERINASNAKFGVHDFSRQELATLTKLPINCVCGRVKELLDMGVLEEQPRRQCKVTHNSIAPVALA